MHQPSKNEDLSSFNGDNLCPSAEVSQKRRDLLQTTLYLITRNREIVIHESDSAKGVHYSSQNNSVEIPKEILTRQNFQSLRIALGEAASRALLDFTSKHEFFEGNPPALRTLIHALELPRAINYLSETLPRFREDLPLIAERLRESENRIREQSADSDGKLPPFLDALFGAHDLWLKERGYSGELPQRLETTEEFLNKCGEALKRSWNIYPEQAELKDDIGSAQDYASLSYANTKRHIWPHFEELIESSKSGKGKGSKSSESSEQESKAGESAQSEASSANSVESTDEKNAENSESSESQSNELSQSSPAEGDSASERKPQSTTETNDPNDLAEEEELDENELSEEELANLLQAIEEEFEPECDLSEAIGDSAETLEDKDDEQSGQGGGGDEREDLESDTQGQSEEFDTTDIYQELHRTAASQRGVYEEARRLVAPISQRLETELRAIFKARKPRQFDTGRRGQRVDIGTRIGEIARDVPPIKTKSWLSRQKEDPREFDYAITLLVDLSKSMLGPKIRETFKATVMLAEVLNRLSIKVEILGFNSKLHHYKPFSKNLDQSSRKAMGEMPLQLEQYTDTGWALRSASDRLSQRKEKERYLIALTDGAPNPSKEHKSSFYELGRVVDELTHESGNKILAVAVGDDTQGVEKYFPNYIRERKVEEIVKKLAQVIEDIVRFGAAQKGYGVTRGHRRGKE